MTLKKTILSLVDNIPNPIAKILIKINIFPNIIFGKNYKNEKLNIKTNGKDYDNSVDLLKMVNYAIENVPYYKERYSQINSIEEFENKIGFINKSTTRDYNKELISENIEKSDYYLITSSGTSGKPLELLIHKNSYQKERAFLHSIWEKKGYKHHTRAVLRNRKLSNGKDYIINFISKEYIFDAFRNTDIYYKKIYGIIKKANIKYIHAYPSSAYSFSTFLHNNNLDVSFLNGFICSSENILEHQRRLITKKLKLELVTIYGHSERIVVAGNCKNSDLYHIEPQYGYFELIDKNDNVIKNIGETGEIVGTTLDNYGMPLIRFKTGDLATYAGNYCEHCQRNVPLLKNIEGKWSGRRIFGANNAEITPTSLVLHDDLLNFIDGIQYIQKEKGKLTILIIKSKNFNDNHEKRLLEHHIRKFSKDTIIKIKYVEKLIKQPNGKFLDLISTVK